MTVREWLEQAKGRLQACGIEAAHLEANVLATHALGVDRSWVLAHPEASIPDESLVLVSRREKHEPLAYILGYREFYGRRFSVSPAVLIPRQETETLVDMALGRLSSRSARVLDLGTGSGCIGITLQLENPALDVTLSDVSQDALSVATANAGSLGAHVSVRRSDGFEGLLGEAFDAIVSNPPYIARHEPIMPEVAEHEPDIALFSGDTGLEFYRMLASEAMNHLLDGGWMAVEVGYAQAEIVKSLFASSGWDPIETVTDLSGILRVVVAGRRFECGA